MGREEFDERIEWEWYYLWHHEGRRARMGASMILSNAYHLHLRPGDELVCRRCGETRPVICAITPPPPGFPAQLGPFSGAQVDEIGTLRDDVVEVGAGKVLSGLVRQINRDVRCLNVENSESLKNTLDSL